MDGCVFYVYTTIFCCYVFGLIFFGLVLAICQSDIYAVSWAWVILVSGFAHLLI